uniref:Uncharacterized protein n=1 Tax=Ditylenchus dipsaci TaxID=166011 RepID=A0A915CR53_9BILA
MKKRRGNPTRGNEFTTIEIYSVVEWHFNGHPCLMVIATEPPTTSGMWRWIFSTILPRTQETIPVWLETS